MQNQESAARTFRHAKREAKFALTVWFCALVWTVGYCYLHGYRHPPDSPLVAWGLAGTNDPGDLRLVLGVPEWVVFGIVVPWLVCTAVTVIFGLFVMADDDLGTDPQDGGEGGRGA